MFRNVFRTCCFDGFNHLHFWKGEPEKPLEGWRKHRPVTQSPCLSTRESLRSTFRWATTGMEIHTLDWAIRGGDSV